MGKVEVWNMALGLMRARPVSVTTESSPSAEACRLYYDMCVDQLLGLVPWGFATSWQTLPVHMAESSPEGTTALAFPADGLKVWDARTGGHPRFQLEQEEGIEYEVLAGTVTKTRMLITSSPKAEFQITRRVDVGLWPAALVDALVFLLASKIAIMVAGVEQGTRLRADNLELHKQALGQAEAEDAGPRRLTRKESKYITSRR